MLPENSEHLILKLLQNFQYLALNLLMICCPKIMLLLNYNLTQIVISNIIIKRVYFNKFRKK